MDVSVAVLEVFGFDPVLTEVKPLGEGLINYTYSLHSENDVYVLQKINTAVFKNPDAIAHNIKWVSDYLKVYHPDYYFVSPIHSVQGNQMEYIDEGYYRVFPYVNGSHAKTVVQNEGQAFEAGYQFGHFTSVLNGINAVIYKSPFPIFII